MTRKAERICLRDFSEQLGSVEPFGTQKNSTVICVATGNSKCAFSWHLLGRFLSDKSFIDLWLFIQKYTLQ